MEIKHGPAAAIGERLAWIDAVDPLLARAEAVVGAARADDAPLADRITLWVDIAALRKRLAIERQIIAQIAPGV